MENRCCCHGST